MAVGKGWQWARRSGRGHGGVAVSIEGWQRLLRLDNLPAYLPTEGLSNEGMAVKQLTLRNATAFCRHQENYIQVKVKDMEC